MISYGWHRRGFGGRHPLYGAGGERPSDERGEPGKEGRETLTGKETERRGEEEEEEGQEEMLTVS